MADQKDTNNITGVKNARIDEILDLYDKEFDQQKRAALIRELDGILANEHHYILTWEEPFQRMAFWNKFGHPESVSHAAGGLPGAPDAVVDRSAERGSN